LEKIKNIGRQHKFAVKPMVLLCYTCKSGLIYFSSDFASTRYYCPTCKKFYTIARTSPPEKKTVKRPPPRKALRTVKKVGAKKILKKTKKKGAPKRVKRKKAGKS
jgi:hypothetical protein